jgi:hypothetical protein
VIENKIERETIGGIPLGLSRDFVHLPPTWIAATSSEVPIAIATYRGGRR